MSLEPADKATEIPVAENIQETNQKYSDSKVLKDLDPEDSEAAMFQFGGDSDRSEEPPGKAVGKYDH